MHFDCIAGSKQTKKMDSTDPSHWQAMLRGSLRGINSAVRSVGQGRAQSLPTLEWLLELAAGLTK